MTPTAIAEHMARRHAGSLMGVARRHSLCAEDAQDAYQRALEIYLERADEVRETTAVQWLRTVTKHEAMKLRTARQRVLPAEDWAWDEQPSPDVSDAVDRALDRARVGTVAEALAACRPDETRAILLRADGCSYAEIAELCGWTYSKVNKSLAEGRARFMRRFQAIETGRACAANRLLLNAIVDGEATVDAFVAVRPHLRHCPGCRAELRELYEAEPELRALLRERTPMSAQ